MAGVNLAVNALAIATGPLIARALGASGRGDLAAIMVPLGFASLVDPGLASYTTREAARGARRPGLIVGSVGPVVLLAGLVVAAAAPLIASLVAHGRPTVHLFLIIGLVLTPITLLANQLSAVTWAWQRWRIWLIVRLIPPIGLTIGTVVLFVSGHLTVTAAAILSLGLSLVAVLPLLTVIPDLAPLRFDAATARDGLRFGSRAWLGNLSAIANARFDQLAMTRLVPPAELGFYAVAVNTTVFQSAISSSIGSVVFPRVSAGDSGLAGSAVRVTLACTAVVSGCAFLAFGYLIPLLFGPEFTNAVPMARILVVAAVPQAGANVLGLILVGAGHPGLAARGQLVALGLTLVGLLALLPPLGGTGAAIVSAVAYSATFLYLLRAGSRVMGLPLAELVVPRPADLHLLATLPGLRRLAPLVRGTSEDRPGF